jgi:hypothetical protein
MNEDNSWRKCAYCGKYMSYDDFENNKIEEHPMEISYEGNEIDPWYAHKKCL